MNVIIKESLSTIKEREHMYTRQEKRRASVAAEFIRANGYPTESEAISMLRDGNIEGIPHTVSDVKAFYDIYMETQSSTLGQQQRRRRNRC